MVLLSTTHIGICALWRSGESEGILKGVVEGIVEGVAWIVLNFIFCRDWRRISILETGIPKLKTGYFRDRGRGWLCKSSGCFTLLFLIAVFCLSNFLCIVRVICHKVLFTFLHIWQSHCADFNIASLQLVLDWQADLQYYLSIIAVGIFVWQNDFCVEIKL